MAATTSSSWYVARSWENVETNHLDSNINDSPQQKRTINPQSHPVSVPPPAAPAPRRPLPPPPRPQRAYHCVEPFIDPVTRAKVVLLPKDEGEARRILDEEIGLEVGRGCAQSRRAGGWHGDLARLEGACLCLRDSGLRKLRGGRRLDEGMGLETGAAR